MGNDESSDDRGANDDDNDNESSEIDGYRNFFEQLLDFYFTLYFTDLVLQEILLGYTL